MRSDINNNHAFGNCLFKKRVRFPFVESEEHIEFPSAYVIFGKRKSFVFCKKVRQEIKRRVNRAVERGSMDVGAVECAKTCDHKDCLIPNPSNLDGTQGTVSKNPNKTQFVKKPNKSDLCFGDLCSLFGLCVLCFVKFN